MILCLEKSCGNRKYAGNCCKLSFQNYRLLTSSIRRHKYTFKPICEEDTSIYLDDGTAKIFLNALGEMDDVSSDLKAFLDYVSGKKTDNDFVEQLDKEVKEARRNREWRHEYMTLLMRDQENLEKGRTLERKKIILNMLRKGYSTEQIMLLVDTTEEEINAYKADLLP